MSNKKQPKTPEAVQTHSIYQGLTKSNEIAKCGIVINLNGDAFLFDTACPLVDKAIAHRWNNWAGDYEKMPIDDRLEWHRKVFNVEPPKGLDAIEWSLMTYMKLAKMAKDKGFDRTSHATEVVRNKDKKVMSRVYLIPEDADPAKIVTPQAKTCFNIVKDAIDPDSGEILEMDLRKHVEERQAELRTRQSPWRIFQYYRRFLMEKGCLIIK